MLGEIVRLRRRVLGMKQKTLADRVGTGQSVISEIERGTRANLTRDLLDRLATALDMPIQELLAADLAPPDPAIIRLPEDVPPAFAQAFLWASQYLTPRQQETVLRFVQSLAAEVAEAERDAQKARRDLDEARTHEAGPIEGKGKPANGLH